MAGDEDAFLRAIAAKPGDDLPRLVFADWLDEHGQPGRAEFVRLDCRRGTAGLSRRERAALDARLRRLYARHGGPYHGAVWLRTGFQWCEVTRRVLTLRTFWLAGPVASWVEFQATDQRGCVVVDGRLAECRRPRIVSLLGRQQYAFTLPLAGRPCPARIVINFTFGLPLGTLAFYVSDTLAYAAG
ncbi:MAG TPA: TIGR02996 domain-containing protein [Gemmataceae bacterium]|jgi:uncharacterized protein (TIGR02996 family)